MSVRFRRRGDVVFVSFAEQEVELLRGLPGELNAVFQAPPNYSDPVYSRLFPTAYLDPTEESAEREWQELVHPDLLRQRLAALQLVTATLDRATAKKGRVEVELRPDDVDAWLSVVNDARLAIGTRLGVTEDHGEGDLDPSDPNAATFAVYDWLTALEGDLVDALLGE